MRAVIKGDVSKAINAYRLEAYMTVEENPTSFVLTRNPMTYGIIFQLFGKKQNGNWEVESTFDKSYFYTVIGISTSLAVVMWVICTALALGYNVPFWRVWEVIGNYTLFITLVPIGFTIVTYGLAWQNLLSFKKKLR